MTAAARILTASALLAGTLLTGSCTLDCTDIGCVTEVIVKGWFHETDYRMEVEVCVEASCDVVTLETDESAEFRWGRVERWQLREQRMTQLNILLSDLYAPPPVEGERLRVTVRLEREVATLDERVEYHDYFPNGPDCGPGCDRAQYSL